MKMTLTFISSMTLLVDFTPFSGPQNAQLQIADDSSESTDIPSAQARWEEESNALDGQAAHLCIASLSDKIIQSLTQTYEQENAPKDPPRPAPASTANAQASSGAVRTEESGTQGGANQGEINRGLPTAPHPSDQVTPSNPSPRDSVSTVDQLRSSLRQVADALAQTVAAVRNTRELLSGGGSSENAPEGGQDGEGELGDKEQQPMESNHRDTEVQSVPEVGTVAQEESSSMETSELPRIQVSLPPPPSSHSPLPPPPPHSITSSPSPTPPPTTTSHTSTTTTTTILSASPTPSNPIMATFDGSQESAVATLASTSPEDPLYTFLSAVAGAPAPPLPESSPLSPPVQQTTQSTATSPRLPVFAQFQSSSGSAIPSSSSSSSNTVEPSHSHSTAIPMSVIQDARTSMASGHPPPSSTASGVSTTEPQVQSITTSAPPTDSSSVADVDVSVLAASIASQVNTTLQQTSDGNTASGNASGLVQAASIADSLAQELVRAVSHFVPTSSSNGSSTSERPPTTTTTATLAATTNTQSPSPSDTLAPLLISSLQLPSSGASRTEPLAEPADPNQQGPSDQEQPIAMEASVRDERTGEVSPMQTEGTAVTSGQSVTEAGQSSSVAAGGEGGGGGTASVLTQDVIDPTFLAALPDPIRDEVLAQHEREQQLRRVQRESGLPSTISPEFLSALPPSIQDEVGTKLTTVSKSVYL